MNIDDIFFSAFRKLNSDSQSLILKIKAHAELLAENMDKIKNREMSLALTNLEQSIMWASKAIVIEDTKTGEKE